MPIRPFRSGIAETHMWLVLVLSPLLVVAASMDMYVQQSIQHGPGSQALTPWLFPYDQSPVSHAASWRKSQRPTVSKGEDAYQTHTSRRCSSLWSRTVQAWWTVEGTQPNQQPPRLVRTTFAPGAGNRQRHHHREQSDCDPCDYLTFNPVLDWKAGRTPR